MTTAGIFLLVLWAGSHILILTVVRITRQSRTILVMISIMIMLAYLLKPYTYDLNKYSIFFHTGFVPVQAWHTPNDNFHLDSTDTTGNPFNQSFGFGFRWLAKLGNITLPEGSLVPRFDTDYGDFKERGPPRSDATIFLIMVTGFFVLLVGVLSMNVRSDGESNFRSIDLSSITPIILGSIFFMLGSQNALRQFLGISIVVLAMSSMVSKRYFLSAILVALSGAFHQWAPILGLIGIYLVALGSLERKNKLDEEVKAFFLSSSEGVALISAIIIVILIKVIMVAGIFNMDIPLLGDLKPYIIKDKQFLALERLSPLIKFSVIASLFLFSEALIGKTKENKSTSAGIRSLRRRTIVLILPFAIYPEIFARVLLLYWAVEILFLVWALNSDKLRVRLGGAAVFLAYGFAPNAINVLIGPNWLYSF